nr:recombinase family protein [uncultured Roseococcus sp.]
MLIGYARTSTTDQEAGLEAQERELKAAGCERMFSERVSSLATQRPQLAEALRFVRSGDTLVVAKPDRLARSTANLLAIVDDLQAREVSLLVLSMGGQPLDTRGATGKLMLTVLGAVAEFERELMLERQREGISKAKTEGKYRGRAPTARAKAPDVLRMHRQGVAGAEIARRLEIGVASVFRILREARSDQSDATNAAR